MSKTAKILVSIGAFFVTAIIITAISSGSPTHNPGVLGVAIVFGLMAALRTIWKENDNNGNANKDEHFLDKS